MTTTYNGSAAAITAHQAVAITVVADTDAPVAARQNTPDEKLADYLAYLMANGVLPGEIISALAETTGIAVTGSGSSPVTPSFTPTQGTGVLGKGGSTAGSGVEGFGKAAGIGVLGVGGATDNSIGVSGQSAATNGSGVTGSGSGTGNGVYGGATAGAGVYGLSSTGVGVIGATNGSGAALRALATGGTGVGIHIQGGSTGSPVRLTPQAAVPSGASNVGDLYMTTAGVLKVCTVAGTGVGATWVSVGAQT